MQGQVKDGHLYTSNEFNRTITIDAREEYRVKTFMGEIEPRQRSLVFCASQDHAAAVRDLIDQTKTSNDPHYCERVTANDGEMGEHWLRQFQDNDKTIPTILTTSQKLSTGVDARNVRNIVLIRPINSMIEFKQIIGRGTRLYDGKDYFTIHDFEGAYQHFLDPEWDGKPVDPNHPLRTSRKRSPGRTSRTARTSATNGKGRHPPGRRKSTHHPAYQRHQLLGAGRPPPVRRRVHGKPVRQTPQIV